MIKMCGEGYLMFAHATICLFEILTSNVIVTVRKRWGDS